MERREPTQKALVLAGGGARGSYQVGVWRALMELDWHPRIITGTSVGGLNGAMFVLDLYETARDMWLTIRSRDVMELPEENADLSALHQFLRRVVKEGGMDVTPLEEIVERVLDEDALRAAPIRFGIVTVEQRGLRPRELTLEDIPAGQVRDYLMASAACFPALRARQIDGVKFLDGGYSDNMPTGLAKTMGAEELVCVDLEGVGITRPNLTGLPTTMIRSYWELGDILHFDPDTAKRNMELGYYDTLRAFGRIRGCAYAVDSGADSSADAEAFRAAFDAVQKEVREKYPDKTIWCFTGFRLDDELLRDGSYPRCEATDGMLACINVLVDGRFVKELKDISLQFRGSRNQRVIDMDRTRETGQVTIWGKQRK